MTSDSSRYTVLNMFGKEHDRSVLLPDLFSEIVSGLADFLRCYHGQLKCRGYIEDEAGRNMAPRAGFYDPSKMGKWLDCTSKGTFMNFELYASDWSNSHPPTVYGSLHKLWNYGPSGYSERTDTGAENCMVVAIPEKSLTGQNSLDSMALSTAPKLDCFYGFIERSVGWDQESRPIPFAGLREYMIDVRWHDVPQEFKIAGSRMDRAVTRLYWSNFLTNAHFSNGPGAVPSHFIESIQRMPTDLYFLRFNRDPQEDKPHHDTLMRYFNSVTPKSNS